MNKTLIKRTYLVLVLAMAFLILETAAVRAAIDGITVAPGVPVNLTAMEDFISTADGGAVLLWGYAEGAGRAQYPGPTLIVNEGQQVTINLTNGLPLDAGNISIVFPGHQVTTAGGTPGILTQEAAIGETVTYVFTASRPGTYLYHSGTRPELQAEMGLVGAIIVRPALGPKYAYNHAGTQFDREYLFVLSDMDSRIHDVVEFLGVGALGDPLFGFDLLSNPFFNYYFINGRTAVDTMDMPNPPGSGLYPTQPYNSMPVMNAGERVLMRIVGLGRGAHPFHHHGNHARIVGRDGRLLDTGAIPAGALPDLSTEVFTVLSQPGQTFDAIFEWTGKGMGWDIYGAIDPAHEHLCNGLTVAEAQALRVSNPNDPYFNTQDAATTEWCKDHGKILPVTLPNSVDLTMGPFFSASPYLGRTEDPLILPVGHQNFNPIGAYIFMWHSHNEKDLLNYGVFPGGMLTMTIIMPAGTFGAE